EPHSLGDHRLEIFPKQDWVQDGPGSLVRLPLGLHRKSGQRYGIDGPEHTPTPNIAEQLRAIAAVRPVPTAYIADLLAERLVDAHRRLTVTSMPARQQHQNGNEPGLVARIKRGVDLFTL